MPELICQLFGGITLKCIWQPMLHWILGKHPVFILPSRVCIQVTADVESTVKVKAALSCHVLSTGFGVTVIKIAWLCVEAVQGCDTIGCKMWLRGYSKSNCMECFWEREKKTWGTWKSVFIVTWKQTKALQQNLLFSYLNLKYV